MKRIRLNMDDRFYYRIRDSGWSYHELLALGYREAQKLTIFYMHRQASKKQEDCKEVA